MTKHFDVTISGKVQGVFFRASTHAKANELGVFGFVKNERDGSVYVEAEGKEENLKEFLEWCSVGPPHAEVSRIDIKEGELKSYSRFEVRH
jgi:acylphosphatase